MKTSQKILFLESGTSGGGSFAALFASLRYGFGDSVTPVVVFLNHTPFYEKLQGIGVQTFLFEDPVYTKSLWKRDVLLKAVQRGIEFLVPVLRPSFDKIFHQKTINKLVETIQKEQVDLLVLNVQIDRDWFALLAAEKTQAPVVSYLRSLTRTGLTAGMAEKANYLVTRYIANSQATQSFWCQWGLDPKKVSVVYDSVDEPSVSDNDTDAPTLNLGKPHICCVGRLNQMKGQRFLLESFAQVADKHPDVKLLFIGDGPDRIRLEKRASHLHLESRVIFAGWKTSARSFMRHADLVVVPSEQEGFGLVVIEAMRCGTGVVASRRGGMPELINDGETGLLVDYGDIQAMSNAILSLLEDSTKLKTMAENGRLFAEHRFLQHDYNQRVLEVYKSANVRRMNEEKGK